MEVTNRAGLAILFLAWAVGDEDVLLPSPLWCPSAYGAHVPGRTYVPEDQDPMTHRVE